MLDHEVFYGACDAYEMLMLIVRLKAIGCMQLINYYFIIQINGCMYSFGWVDNFILIMVFSVKLVNNKVVYNLLVYLVLNFQSHRPYSLGIIAVRTLLSEILAL